MTETRVRELLNAHMQNIGRVGHLTAEIERLEREYVRTRADLIDAKAGPKAQTVSDMPHGSGISNPTEQLGMSVAEGFDCEDLRRIRRKIDKARLQLEDAETNKAYVIAWLDGLSDRERFVIEHKRIQHEYWHEVQDDYAEQYNVDVTIQTLQRYELFGLRKIFKIAK